MKDVLTIEYTIHGIVHHTTRVITNSTLKSYSDKDSEGKEQSEDPEDDIVDQPDQDEDDFSPENDDEGGEQEEEPGKYIVKMPLSPDSVSGSSSPLDENAEKLKKEHRKQLSIKYTEDVRRQALEKILKDQLKKPKKMGVDVNVTVKKDLGPKIKYHISKNNKICLSFPNGFILPKILSYKEPVLNKLPQQLCNNCGQRAKYLLKEGKGCCSLGCYKKMMKK